MATERSGSPPPKKSSPWPWRGRTRRHSESSLPSLRELVTGRRNSLSAVDTTQTAVLRKKPPAEISTPGSRTPERRTTDGNGVAVGAAGTAKSTRKPQSRPPPAFFNRPPHRHTFSASAALRWYTVNREEDDALLKPPAPRLRPSSSDGLPPSIRPTAAPPFLRQPWAPLDVNPRAMYPPEEQEFAFRTQRASTKVQPVTNSQPSARGSDMEHMPPIHKPTAYPDSSPPGLERPGGYNTPRRLSNSSASSATSSVMSGQDSFDGRTRTASTTSSQTSVDSWPNSPGIGWQAQGGPPGQSYPWQRPATTKVYRRKAQGELFTALPGEVLELILEELRKLHFRPGTSSCATCWMRDCCSVAVSARKFVKYAREALYHDIQLVGYEGQNMKKRTKTTHGSRLVLLRRTLRANPQVAAVVRSLKPPARPSGVGAVEYNDLVASVVMACPNLERLVGFYPTYDHSFQRLFQALSTRQKLKDMRWILEPSSLQRQEKTHPASQNGRWDRGELQQQQAQWFMGFHLNWKQLTTFVVHCQPGATLNPPNLLECAIRSLPSLQHLYLSRVPHTSFNNTNLASLPALKTLSLSHCPGVTTAGLSSMATRPSSASIQTLTLVHMGVESLPAIARLFSYLTSLETFNIVQTFAPSMPADEFMMLFPYLASQPLRKLHWDIPFLPDSATPADAILARSITAGGFPSLRSLCAPNDPEGLFQSVCAPRERIDHATDRFRGGQSRYSSTTGSRTSTPTTWQGFGHTRNNSSFSSTHTAGRGSSFMSASTPPPQTPPGGSARDNSNLHAARLAAQARLEAAQRQPRFFVNVVDEAGAVVEKHAVGAFLGTIESRIRYVLSAEAATGATDESGGLVGVEDLIASDGGEAVGPLQGDKAGKKGKREKEADEAGRREGCIGRWNTFSGAVVDKKDRERWWHQERGRWRELVLS